MESEDPIISEWQSDVLCLSLPCTRTPPKTDKREDIRAIARHEIVEDIDKKLRTEHD
jgi:hypothetical protein